jgi:hypothetical protein
MQRWQQESMRDQPYNNIGAVTIEKIVLTAGGM